MAKSRIPLSSATLLMLLVATSAQVIVDNVVSPPEEPAPSAVCRYSYPSLDPACIHLYVPVPLRVVDFATFRRWMFRSTLFKLGGRNQTLQDCLQNAQNVIYKYGFAAQEWIQYPGGLYKASNTANFPASDKLSGALFKLNPGGSREMHWHNPNEWGFVLNGTCRATLVNQGSTHMVESCKVLST